MSRELLRLNLTYSEFLLEKVQRQEVIPGISARLSHPFLGSGYPLGMSKQLFQNGSP